MVNVEDVKKLLQNNEIDEHFRMHLEAIAEANGDMQEAFHIVSAVTPYRSFFLFNKSMEARIKNALNGKMPRPVKKSGEKKSAKKEEKQEEKQTETSAAVKTVDEMFAGADKKVQDTVELIKTALQVETEDEFNALTKAHMLEIKGVGPKKVEAIESYLGRTIA